jgi:hypothetical protein
MTPDDVLDSLAEECQTDHLGLWEIVDAVRLDLGTTTAPEVRAVTLRLVHRLLSERQMQVGHPAPDGRHFISWGLSPDQAVSRIEKEWSNLGREPNIGELAWFTSVDQASDKPRQQIGLV